jgi:hypothetical protein
MENLISKPKIEKMEKRMTQFVSPDGVKGAFPVFYEASDLPLQGAPALSSLLTRSCLLTPLMATQNPPLVATSKSPTKMA